VKVVFASTRQIYGRPEYLPVDESHLLRPVNVNGINKMAGEWYHILYNDVYGVRTCALRLTNTYGPRMRIKDARQTFLGIWVRCVIEGHPFQVWGGEQLRDFTFVDDAVEAFLLAGASDETNGRVYNLGGDPIISLSELATLVVEAADAGTFEQHDFPVDRKRIDIGDYYANDQLIRSSLGWAPQTPLSQGLKQTIDFYREHFAQYL
jgi:UDP-glucose 4-epimerase